MDEQAMNTPHSRSGEDSQFDDKDRPIVIGVTGPDRGGGASWLFTKYAIRRAGGFPVRVTPSQPISADTLDGLVLGGGADVGPQLYGEERVAPSTRSSILGCVAAVIETVSPSQLSPAVIQRTSSSAQAGDRNRSIDPP